MSAPPASLVNGLRTELVHTDRDYGNSGPLAVKELGRVCYASAHRAIAALRALVEWSEFRAASR